MACALAVLGAWSTTASACSLDGVASLTINGYVAAINKTAPTAQTRVYWAAFSLGSIAPGQAANLGEVVSKIRGTLPSTALQHPFRWDFGDGHTAQGTAVSHVYSNPGWYKVNVQYYWTSRKQWLLFDSGQLHVATSTQTASFFAGNRPLVLSASVLVGVGCLLLMVRTLMRSPVEEEPDYRAEVAEEAHPV